MPQYLIPVIEYGSTKHQPGTGMSRGTFLVNDRQLVVAMVRSILTANANRASRRYMAAIVKPSLRFMIESSPARHLRIKSAFQGSVRDFSVTTRIGELAQGAAYAYWQWGRGYVISDFAGWAQANGVAVAAGAKSPDYVMTDPLTAGTILMEAKGTRSDNHKGKMSDALRQIRPNLTTTGAGAGYGTVLTLDAGNSTGWAKLHLRDPAEESKAAFASRYCAFRRAYAAWFELTGDIENADALREVQANTGSLTLAKSNSKRLREDPLRASVAEALGFNPDVAWFYILPEVFTALEDAGSFRQMNWLKVRSASMDWVLDEPRGAETGQAKDAGSGKPRAPSYSKAAEALILGRAREDIAGTPLIFPDGTRILSQKPKSIAN